MPRKALIRTDIYPYHVTIRCNNKEWFDLPLERVWNICVESIRKADRKHSVSIQAFVLMSNHYHLLVMTPDSNLDLFMFELNKEISRKIRLVTGRINRIFGDRYKWSVITDQRHFTNVLKYIYLNPLRSNLVNRCEKYLYSTLHYLWFNKKFSVSLFQPYFGELDLFVEWLNMRYSDEELAAIKYGIGRSIFKIPVSKSSRRSSFSFFV